MEKKFDLENSVFKWVQQMPIGVIAYRVDGHKEILYSNEKAWDLFGCQTAEEFREYSQGYYGNLIFEEDIEHVLMMTRALTKSESRTLGRVQYRVKDRTGTLCPVEDVSQLICDPDWGNIIVRFMVRVDNEILMIDTGSDKLTKLLSMGPFITAARQILKLAQEPQKYSYLFCNICNFKHFNVKMGKDAGDKVLKDLANLLIRYSGEDLIARFADDHFVILSDAPDILRRIQQTRDDFNLLHARDGLDLKIGIYQIQEAQEEIVKCCDFAKMACDSIHDSVKSYFCYYNDRMSESVEITEYAIKEIGNAIARGEIKVFYQPVVRTISGNLCSFEALARWDSAEKGMLSPVHFVPALERSRQIQKLDLYVIEEVCRRLSAELDAGCTIVPVSVNISRMDILECDIFSEVEKLRTKYHIAREMLCIEITESMLIGDNRLVLEVIRKFQNAGYEVWMDDFGSGYSSLNQLSEHGFDEVKLDMRFMMNLTEESKKIIKNTIRMAKEVGIQTLTEGVETKEQYIFLRNIGCEKVQGFYFGQPLPYEEAVENYRSKNLMPETRELKQYYAAIGRSDFITERALSLVEFRDGIFHYLFINEPYLEVLYGAGRHDLEEIRAQLNSASSPATRQLLKYQAVFPNDNQFHDFDYVLGDNYLRLRFKRIATLPDRMAYQAEAINITRKSDLEGVREVDKTLRLLSGMFDAIYIVDREKNLVSPLMKGTGYQHQQISALESASIEDTMRLIRTEVLHPDEWQAFEEWSDVTTLPERIMASGNSFLMGLFRSKEINGAYVWKMHRVMVFPQSNNNKFVYTITSATDLEENIKRATGLLQKNGNLLEAERLKDLMDSDVIRMFWKDANRRFIGVNKAFLDYFGMKDSSLVIGKTDEEMHWHVDDEAYRYNEQKVIKYGENDYFDHGKVLLNGQLRDIFAFKAPIYEKGQIVGLVGYFFDLEGLNWDRRKLENLQCTDELTGLLNSSGLLVAITDYMDSLNREKVPFALIRIGIRRYDRVVSTYGENAANRYLKQYTDIILSEARYMASIGRIYGANFVLCVQYKEKSEIEQLQRRIERKINRMREEGGIAVTETPLYRIVYADGATTISNLWQAMQEEEL